MKYIRDKLSTDDHRFTQDDAARILNVSRSTIVRCERGEKEPESTFERFQLFSHYIKQATGVDIASIPGFRFSDSRGQEIFEYYEKLRKKEKVLT